MHRTACILLFAALLSLSVARADTLVIEGLEQAKATAANRPARGMSMNAVSARWGNPVTKLAAVGQPPITRWEYGDFIVYFEYDHVIDAVVRHP